MYVVVSLNMPTYDYDIGYWRQIEEMSSDLAAASAAVSQATSERFAGDDYRSATEQENANTDLDADTDGNQITNYLIIVINLKSIF